MQVATFATTHWSVVAAAARSGSPESRAALESLCRSYWYPLYAYTRRRGYGPEDAQDLTQEFFHQFLASDWIGRAEPTRGRFRSFLLRGLQNLLANEWQKRQRLKRGAGNDMISLDAFTAEERYHLEPADDSTADKLFERRWAMTLLQRVIERLQAEQASAGNAERFVALREVLLGEPDNEGYSGLARRLGWTESALKTSVHRLRQRYRELLREEVARTVGDPNEVRDELCHLLRVVAR